MGLIKNISKIINRFWSKKMSEKTMTKLENISFVTKSQNKIREVERILGFSIKSVHFDLPEIQAVELEAVIYEKAIQAFEKNEKKPVMIEDTGLFIDAWNGLPGALVRWFIDKVGVDGICTMLQPYENKRAIAKTSLVIFDGDFHVFTGELEGSIASEPRGNNGFGWDSIFIPYGDFRTFAEMTDLEKDQYSMRKLALEKLRQFGLSQEE